MYIRTKHITTAFSLSLLLIPSIYGMENGNLGNPGSSNNNIEIKKDNENHKTSPSEYLYYYKEEIARMEKEFNKRCALRLTFEEYARLYPKSSEKEVGKFLNEVGLVFAMHMSIKKGGKTEREGLGELMKSSLNKIGIPINEGPEDLEDLFDCLDLIITSLQKEDNKKILYECLPPFYGSRLDLLNQKS